MPLPPSSILILAGGRGQRMGGRDKGLVEWQGQPLVAHVQRAVRALTDDLVISCNRNAERYAQWADQLVADEEPDYPGPLAGILAGLTASRHAWVLLLPCDAPRIDAAFAQQLLAAAQASQGPVMARQGGYWQPLFAALPRHLLPALRSAWAQGERSPRGALLPLGLTAVDFAEDDPRLANFNDPTALESPV
ncbi:molybdenum cofactor guanylyltransferase MobA [Pseudomonas oryzihabitans]|uniref:molybdenum cofactor guanylyltransferase MobA n=1 Tax=Pseudomonas oryzihabitans TaxID=47885 RepID=UPI0028561C3B|nr:molybdenum cofactor guanylyltransferase MobA [Pseudomonas psychrotolerans]MDR6677808.1 molybdopterin-guanine dinucleotide biosynthesis protein A [Pseudomonas psychrotolerans]